jgi:hypothetical protein
MPPGEAKHDHGNYGNKNKYFENSSGFRNHLNPANIDPRDQGDQDERNEPVLPADDLREVESQVVGEEHGVGAAEKE